jgi:hypothetical protein
MVTTLLYGLYSGAVAIALTLIGYFTGMDKTSAGSWFGYLNLPFMILFIYLASKERKEDFGGSLTYGQGVGTGVLVGLWAGIVTAIFMWIYLNYLNPGFIDMIVDRQRTAMLQAHKMSPQDVERMLTTVRRLAMPISVGGVLVSSVFFATIIALITSIFVQTKETAVGEIKSV